MPNLISESDFDSIFRTIHTHLVRNNFANPHKCCTFFSVTGAAILNICHNIKAHSRSGAAMFDVGLNHKLVFADPNSQIVTHCNDGFHSWIETDDWFIDFTSPLFPEMIAPLNIGNCDRMMLQKPLCEAAPSISELNTRNCFCLFPDYDFTLARIDSVIENNAFFNIMQECIDSYKNQHL